MSKQRKRIGFQTLEEAIVAANVKGFPYAVQEWSNEGQPTDYVVAHGSGDGIGKTVYACIPPTTMLKIDADWVAAFNKGYDSVVKEQS